MDAKTEGRATASAAEKLLDNPGLTVERLPMLTVIFDRLAASCAEGIRPYSPALLTCFVNSITTDHVWDALDAYDGSVAAILYSPELDARVLVGLDRRCLFSLMEVLLGGDAQEPQVVARCRLTGKQLFIPIDRLRFARQRIKEIEATRRPTPANA